MKRRATGLLVLMAVVFVAAWLLEPAHPWLGYVRATAEAGMVGGVADWFAITALFRRPLNLPIPHTAIIPQRKDRIGRSLGNFVQNNFLSPEVLGAKLRAAGSAGARPSGCGSPSTRGSVVRQAAGALRSATAVVRDDDVHALLERTVIEPLKRGRSRPCSPTGSRCSPSTTGTSRCSTAWSWAWPVWWPRTTSSSASGSARRAPGGCRGSWTSSCTTGSWTGSAGRCPSVSADPDHPLRRQLDELLVSWIEQLASRPR